MHVTIYAALAAALIVASAAEAQSYSTGQVVYATPTGASNGWYSGCIVGTGRSNSSYQVECAGTTWWISSDHIRTSAPQPQPDPMSPGRTLTPVVRPSHETAAARVTPPPARVPAAPAPTQPQATGGYAQDMARRIAQDKVDAANAVLSPGKYSCYASGRYTFSDLYITGPHSYTVKPGGSGAYSYAHGALTFTSGPYEGAYSRMVDGHTIGVSAKGNTNLGTQCELTK